MECLIAEVTGTTRSGDQKTDLARTGTIIGIDREEDGKQDHDESIYNVSIGLKRCSFLSAVAT